jgi:hypothetical protein
MKLFRRMRQRIAAKRYIGLALSLACGVALATQQPA